MVFNISVDTYSKAHWSVMILYSIQVLILHNSIKAHWKGIERRGVDVIMIPNVKSLNSSFFTIPLRNHLIKDPPVFLLSLHFNTFTEVKLIQCTPFDSDSHQTVYVLCWQTVPQRCGDHILTRECSLHICSMDGVEYSNCYYSHQIWDILSMIHIEELPQI